MSRTWAISSFCYGNRKVCLLLNGFIYFQIGEEHHAQSSSTDQTSVSLSSSRKSRKFPSKEMERSSICLRTKLSREGNNSIQSFITRADKSCNSFGISRTIPQFLPFESLRNYWVRILNTNLFSVVVMFPVWEIEQSSILYRTLIN
jgi:hypothetical protein